MSTRKPNLPSWIEEYYDDESGYPYYYNKKDNSTTWELPTFNLSEDLPAHDVSPDDTPSTNSPQMPDPDKRPIHEKETKRAEKVAHGFKAFFSKTGEKFKEAKTNTESKFKGMKLGEKFKNIKSKVGQFLEEELFKDLDENEISQVEVRFPFLGNRTIWTADATPPRNMISFADEEPPPKLPDNLRSSSLGELLNIQTLEEENEELENARKRLQDADDYGEVVPPEHEESVEKLSHYLAGDTSFPEIERYRAIYSWICHHISYDVEALLSGKRTATKSAEVLKSRKAVCAGYANLFYDLCKKSQLKVFRVSGHAAASRFELNLGQDLAHAWNAICIEGKWALIDSTWGAGSVDAKGKFKFNFDDYYFCPIPSQLIHTHFPEQQEWQLIQPPLNLMDFQNLIPVKPNFFKKNIEFISHKNSRIKWKIHERNLHRISLKAPKDVLMTGKLLFHDQSREVVLPKSFLFNSRTKGVTTFEFDFPYPGKYSFEIFSKKKNGKQLRLSNTGVGESYELSAEYALFIENDPDHPVPEDHERTGQFPITFPEFQKSSFQLISPQNNFKAGRHNFQIQVTDEPVPLKVSIVVGKQWIALKYDSKTGVFNGEVDTRPGEVKVLANFEKGSQSFSSLLHFQCY